VTVVTEGEKGTVSVSSFIVPYGTALSTSGDVLTVGDIGTSVATPAPADAQYTYEFINFTEGDTIVLTDWTVTAHFRPIVNCYTVYVVTEGEKGSVSVAQFDNVPYGTEITYVDNVLSLSDRATTSVATAAPADAQYTYGFVGWTEAPKTVTSDWTVTAHFAPVVNLYTVYFKAIGEKGTVSIDKIENVPYGTALSDVGTKFTVAGMGTCDAIVAPADAQYTYAFVEWQAYPETVVADTTIVAVFAPTTNLYTVYFSAIGQKGEVSIDKITDVPYGTPLSAVGTKFTVGGMGTCDALVAPADAQYTYRFVEWQEYPATVVKDTYIVAVFEPIVNQYTVTVVTEGEKGTVDVNKYVVDYGTKLSTAGNILTVAGYGQTVATPAEPDLRYTYSFINYTEGDTTIVSDWVVTAHFKPTAIPYSVVIKYMCDGAPILKDGVDIRVNSQGEWGSTFTYNYLDNPKFDTTMASKYTLLKGYVEQPPMLADQGETVSVLINENLTVIVFEFNKKGAYVQFHRQTNPVANPVYETPEPYGDAHTATLQAVDAADAGKVIKVLITDNVIGDEAQGTFIGAGQSATYNGYTYSVNQLPKIVKEGLTYDAVEVVISGGLNVHDDINDPLVIWYQMA
jgi:hypothetical protein